MSRYTGPRVKIARAVGVDLPGLTAKTIEKRPYPPGQHGQGRKKFSEYAIRVLETKKVRMNFGLTEAQLRKLVVEARSRPTATSALLELIERRLDNVVFRAGLARTIPAARQLVNHGRVSVNGIKTDIASFRVGRGDTIYLVPTKAGLPEQRFPVPDWLEVDREQAHIRVCDLPDGLTTLFPVQMKLLIEHYAMARCTTHR
jgi:small subunit ribosomal protein S4